MSPIIRFAVPAAVSLASIVYSANSNPLLCDTKKRDFYEDDDDVTPIPGTIVPASTNDIKSLGPNQIVNGVSIRSPSVIENAVKKARLQTYSYYTAAQAKYEELAKRYYSAERDLTTTVSSLHERKEDLLPNAIYVIVGALAGSIVARRRNFLIRGISPLFFGLVSFKIFLPQTFENTRAFAWNLEKKNVPQVAEQQQKLYEKVEVIANDVEKTYEASKEKANNTISSTEKAIAEFTGLNLGEDVTKKK